MNTSTSVLIAVALNGASKQAAADRSCMAVTSPNYFCTLTPRLFLLAEPCELHLNLLLLQARREIPTYYTKMQGYERVLVAVALYRGARRWE